MSVHFVVSESLHSVALAAGIAEGGDNIHPPCALMVGDTISWPAAPGLFFRVISRHFHDGKWVLVLEQAGDPLAKVTHTPLPPSKTGQ